MNFLGHIARVLMLSNFLLDAGIGAGCLPILAEAQDAITTAQIHAVRTGRFGGLPELIWRPMARLLLVYDDQLSRAPSSEVLRAMVRYDDATRTAAQPPSHDVRLLESDLA